MCGEEGAAAVDIVQMLQRSPGDGQAIIRGCPAPNLVQDHQRPVVSLIQDRRRFHHFDHKGGSPPRQVVRCANAAEQLADKPDMGPRGRNEAAGLRQKGDQGILAQKGGFSGHVRAGQQPDCRCFFCRQNAIVGNEGSTTLTAQGALHHRMPTPGNPEGPAVRHDRLHPVLGHSKVGQGCGQIDLCQGPRGRSDWASLRKYGRFQAIIEPLFNFQRMIAGVQDACLKVGQRHGGKAQLVGRRLAVHEGF